MKIGAMIILLVAMTATTPVMGETANVATTMPLATTMPTTMAAGSAAPMGSVSPAAPSVSAPVVTPSPLDSELIHNGTGDAAGAGLDGAANGQSAGAAARGGSPVGLLRVTLALLGVLGLIILMKIAMRWMWPGSAAQRASRSVQVIARTPLSNRSALVLVKVGKRLVVVGDCGTQLSAICQITDPDEVAGMLGAVQTERLGSAARKFAIRLGRAEADFETDDDAALSGVDVGDSSGIGEGEPTRNEGDAEGGVHRPERLDRIVGEPAEPDALANTRQELHGLASRVRTLAEKYRKPPA